MNQNAERLIGKERMRPGVSPVLYAAVAALVVTLLLAFFYLKGKRTEPAGTQKQERSSSVMQERSSSVVQTGSILQAGSPARAQKPSPLRPMDPQSARAARMRMRLTESADR